MTRAADILRKRCKAPFDPGMVPEWRAVAELMEAGYRRYAAGRSCRFCEAEYWNTGPGGVEREWKPHKANCALAALERAITGENK